MNAGQPVPVLMGDADHFKHISDTHGHLVGDDVLIKMGQTLAGELRRLDLLARYGGEEFAVLLPNVTNTDAPQQSDCGTRSNIIRRTPHVVCCRISRCRSVWQQHLLIRH
jgi:diguanylate cyclase (GGDEF)-like protein